MILLLTVRSISCSLQNFHTTFSTWVVFNVNVHVELPSRDSLHMQRPTTSSLLVLESSLVHKMDSVCEFCLTSNRGPLRWTWQSVSPVTFLLQMHFTRIFPFSRPSRKQSSSPVAKTETKTLFALGKHYVLHIHTDRKKLPTRRWTKSRTASCNNWYD